MPNLIFDNRAQIDDRRSWDRVRSFPVKDCNGVLVHQDRRQSAERRGYQLEEITDADVNMKNLLQ